MLIGMSRSMRLLLLQRSFSDHLRSSTSKALALLSKTARESRIAGEWWGQWLMYVCRYWCSTWTCLFDWVIYVIAYICFAQERTVVIYSKHVKFKILWQDTQRDEKTAMSLPQRGDMIRCKASAQWAVFLSNRSIDKRLLDVLGCCRWSISWPICKIMTTRFVSYLNFLWGALCDTRCICVAGCVGL